MAGGALGAFPDPIAFALNVLETVRAGIVVARELSRNVPVLDDEVVVEVTGQPGADKQQLYFLALATANSLVRNRGGLLQLNPFQPAAYGALQIEYDAAANWVRCTLSYRTGTLGAGDAGDVRVGVLPGLESILSGVPIIAGVVGFPFDTMVVYRGPACDVVGNTFGFVSPLLPGIPLSSKSPGAPQLPFVGRTILTGCPTVVAPVPAANTTPKVPSGDLVPNTTIPTPNPKPPGDNRSRGVIKGAIVPPVSPGVSTSLNSGGPTAATTPMTPGSGGAAYMTGTTPGCCPGVNLLIPLVFAALSDPGGVASESFPAPNPDATLVNV